MKNWKLIILLLPLLCFLSACFNHTFTSLTDTKYDRQRPCEPEIIRKFKENTKDNYLLIGTCEAKATSGTIGNNLKNNAMDELLVCACENGGQMIRVLSHEEIMERNSAVVLSRNAVFSVPMSTKSPASDRIYAEIYVRK